MIGILNHLNKMKKLYRIMWDKLDTELDRFEIKQELGRHEQRKRK